MIYFLQINHLLYFLISTERNFSLPYKLYAAHILRNYFIIAYMIKDNLLDHLLDHSSCLNARELRTAYLHHHISNYNSFITRVKHEAPRWGTKQSPFLCSRYDSYVVRAGRLSTADRGNSISAIYHSFPPTRNNLYHLRFGRRPTGQ